MNTAEHRRLIAAGACCSIEECSCGTIHLTFGAMTLRMPKDAIESLWITLGAAIKRLASESKGGTAICDDLFANLRRADHGRPS